MRVPLTLRACPITISSVITPLSEVVIRLADAVGAAQSLHDVYEAALEGVRAVTGIERASILLFDDDGVMRFKAWSGLSEAYRSAVEGHTPWSPGDPPPQSVIVPDVLAEPSLAAYQTTFAKEDIRAVAFIPLVSRRRVVGKFMLYRDAPDAFDRGEVEAALAIGYQIGFAVERIRSEQNATAARQRMVFALDAAQMGTWEWDIASNTVQWSENLERIHGLPSGTFSGAFASYAREIHPDDRPRVLASLTRALEDGAIHDVEYRIVSPDGVTRWVHGKGRLERDADGRPARMTGVCMDVSARKRSDEDVRDALAHEAALRTRLGLLTDGAERLLGSLTPEEVVGQVVNLAASIVVADGYAVWRCHGNEWRVAASRGLSDRFVATVVQADPRVSFLMPVLAVDVQTTPMLEERRNEYRREGIVSLVSIPLAIRGEPAGSIAYYYRAPHHASVMDLQVATALAQLAAAAISNADLHGAQQRLRQEAEDAHLRAAFLAQASDVLASLDYERNLQRVAELAVPQLSDWCAVDLLSDEGKIQRLATTHTDPAKVEWARELHERYAPSLSDVTGVGSVIRTGSAQLTSEISDDMLVATARDEEQLRIARELRLQSAMIVPLTAGRGTFGALTFVSTVGGRRFNEADLDFAMELGRRAALAIENARLYQEARNANRLKDEFLATLSHELRTPLNVIVGRTRRLADLAADAAAVKQNAETIGRNADALTRLVEDLLDVSRFTLGQVALDVRLVDIGTIVQSVLASLEPMARARRIALRTNVQSDIPELRCDATRMQQVVWNLVTNAIKFTPEGGHVTVSVRHSDPSVELVVSDTGIGISPAFLPHVFDMFRQGERSGNRTYGGLGLGLSIVRRLVELHGGTVSASSPGEGAGATFTVRVPCAEGASQSVA
jgi:PAS domain S-box-containing protein